MGRFGTSWGNSRVKSMLRQGLMHRNKQHLYSISSSAGPSSEISGSRPSGALAHVTAVRHPSFCILTGISCAPYRAGLWHWLTEHVLEIACLSTGLAAGAEGDGVCADATAAATVSDRTVAQNVPSKPVPTSSRPKCSSRGTAL